MRLLLEKNQEHSVLLPFWMYTTFAYQQKHLLLILSSVTSANWLISNISTEAGCQRLTSSLNWTNLTSHTLTLASRLQARCDSLKLEFNAGGGTCMNSAEDGYVFGGRRGAKVYRPNWICDDEGALWLSLAGIHLSSSFSVAVGWFGVWHVCPRPPQSQK